MFWTKEKEKSWDNPCDDVVRRLAGSGSYIGEDWQYTYIRYGDKVFKLSRAENMGIMSIVPLSHCAMTPCDGFSLKDAEDGNIQWETLWSRKEVSPEVVEHYEKMLDGLRQREWTKKLDEARGWN